MLRSFTFSFLTLTVFRVYSSRKEQCLTWSICSDLSCNMILACPNRLVFKKKKNTHNISLDFFFFFQPTQEAEFTPFAKQIMASYQTLAKPGLVSPLPSGAFSSRLKAFSPAFRSLNRGTDFWYHAVHFQQALNKHECSSTTRRRKLGSYGPPLKYALFWFLRTVAKITENFHDWLDWEGPLRVPWVQI